MKKIIFCIALLNLTILSQWVNQTVIPHPPAINSVYALSSDYGFAAADSGKILRTSNAGLNWSTFNILSFNLRPAHSIQATTQDTLFCINNNPPMGRIFKSTNSGISWVLNYPRTGGIFYDVKFINSLTGYVYGQPSAMLWFIARTTNGGATWDSNLTRPIADSPGDIGFPNALHLLFTGQINIWFGTSAMKIFYSSNSGNAWNPQFTNGSQNIYSITFLDQQTGFAGGFLPFKTTNSGTFWQQQLYTNTGPFYSFVNSSGRTWYSSGPNIFYSTNGGLNFILQYTSPDNSIYKHISMTFAASDNSMSILTGWGVTGDGVISRYTETVGIQQIGTNIPDNFKLEQNYPNPFNPVTSFKFNVSGSSHVKIVIYNITGEEVATLVDSELKPGVYKAEWNATNYPSGIYFYKLIVTGASTSLLKAGSTSFTETKKMVFVK